MKNVKAAWNAFLHWKGWSACKNAWLAFLHWKGWNALVMWSGWKKLFCPKPWVLALLVLLSCAGLFWVFAGGNEEAVPAYGVYVLSAYTLTAGVVLLPGLIQKGKAAVHAHPLLERVIQDRELRFTLSLYAEQVVNFGYGIFKIAAGVIYGSAWIGADGIYNFTQGVMQLIQILRRRKPLTPVQQWKSYRICGWLTLLLHVTMTGPIFQVVNMGRWEDYPGLMIFATAAFTFYKLIDSFVDVAKDRKHPSPVDSAVRLLDLSQAFFSLFSLQVALLHTFGQEFTYGTMFNAATGGVVCLLVMGMGVYMIRRANKAIKQIDQERENG